MKKFFAEVNISVQIPAKNYIFRIMPGTTSMTMD